MKLDDRDIVAEPSYEPLSNAELVAHIETYAGLIYDMPLAERGRWQGDIVGPARVLLARAEAAEAEAERAAQQWRPVTEKPAAPGRYLVWCPSPWPGYEIAPYDRGWGYIDLRFTHWQPLPPAPDTQEPTL